MYWFYCQENEGLSKQNWFFAQKQIKLEKGIVRLKQESKFQIEHCFSKVYKEKTLWQSDSCKIRTLGILDQDLFSLRNKKYYNASS